MTTVQTSSVSDVITALCSTFSAMSVVTADRSVYVYDGEPPSNPADKFIQVGGGSNPITSSGQQDWASLGAPNGVMGARDESYTVHCYISTFSGSDTATSVRQSAFVLFNAIETALVLDPKLTVGLGNAAPYSGAGLGTGWVGIGAVDLLQTDSQDPELEKGRRAIIEFEVKVFHRMFTN